MTTLLISGSRDASPAMCAYARACVMRARENDWDLICGDAVGVDQAVAEAVRDINAEAPEDEWRIFCDVYGLSPEPRHRITGKGLVYRQLTNVRQIVYGRRDVCVYYVPVTTYAARDRYMVERCDSVMCIWNGRSSGTKVVFHYAKKLGKECWLKRDE